MTPSSKEENDPNYPFVCSFAQRFTPQQQQQSSKPPISEEEIWNNLRNSPFHTRYIRYLRDMVYQYMESKWRDILTMKIVSKLNISSTLNRFMNHPKSLLILVPVEWLDPLNNANNNPKNHKNHKNNNNNN